MRLGNFIEEYTKRNKSQEDIPVYSVTNSQGFCKDYFGKQIASDNRSQYKIVPKGYFAYSPPRINVGSIAYQDIEENIVVSPLYTVFKIKEGINPYYLLYFLKSSFGLEMIRASVTGSVRMNLKFESLSEFDIPIPSMEVQEDFVKKINLINQLIQEKHRQLDLLDELVKSRFIELFGERLEKETVKLSTLTEVITKGTTPTTLGFEFTESGVNFVKIECITEDGKFIVPKMLHISDECNQKLKRSILQEGDVLFSIAGAIGRTAIVTKEILPANTNQAVAIIRLRKDCGLNVKFLNQMLHSSLIEKQVNVKKAGVAQINLSLTDIGDFNIVVPPMEEQEQFATFVEQTDKSKLAITETLKYLEELKASLMAKYFE